MHVRVALLAIVLAGCREASPPTAPLVTTDVSPTPRPVADPPDAAVASDESDGAPFDPEAAEAEILRSIRDLSPNERAITDHARTLFIDHQELLLRSMRVVPDQAKGTIRIFGIRAGSILARLGMQNGDTILRILGQPVDTPDAAAQAWTAMARAQQIDIDLERRGQPLQLLIHVE